MDERKEDKGLGVMDDTDERERVAFMLAPGAAGGIVTYNPEYLASLALVGLTVTMRPVQLDNGQVAYEYTLSGRGSS